MDVRLCRTPARQGVRRCLRSGLLRMTHASLPGRCDALRHRRRNPSVLFVPMSTALPAVDTRPVHGAGQLETSTSTGVLVLTVELQGWNVREAGRRPGDAGLCCVRKPGYTGCCEIAAKLKSRMDSSEYMPKVRMIGATAQRFLGQNCLSKALCLCPALQRNGAKGPCRFSNTRTARAPPDRDGCGDWRHRALSDYPLSANVDIGISAIAIKLPSSSSL